MGATKADSHGKRPEPEPDSLCGITGLGWSQGLGSNLGPSTDCSMVLLFGLLRTNWNVGQMECNKSTWNHIDAKDWKGEDCP